MRRVGASPILGMDYGPDPEKLKAYATKDVQDSIDLYRKMWSMMEWQREYNEHQKWIRQLKANNRRNKRARHHGN